MPQNSEVQLNGSGLASNGTQTVTLIPAQGAGTVIRVLELNVNVIVNGSGGTPIWSVQDANGTPVLVHQGAGTIAGGTSNCEYGGGMGFAITANQPLNLVVSGATTQCTVFASVTAQLTK